MFELKYRFKWIAVLVLSTVISACSPSSVEQSSHSEGSGSSQGTGNSFNPPGSESNGKEDYKRSCQSLDSEIPERIIGSVTAFEYGNIANDILPASADLTELAKILQSWNPIAKTFHFDNNSPLLADEIMVEERLKAAEEMARLMKLSNITTCGSPGDKLVARACFDKFIPLMERLTRSELASSEINKYKVLFDAQYDQARSFNIPVAQLFGEAMEAVYIATFMSPQFLFKYELPRSVDFKGVQSLSQASLAERLSFYLTGSIPDAGLWNRVKAKQLSSTQVMKTEAVRLLNQSINLDRFVVNFGQQWLGYEDRFNLNDRLKDNGPFYSELVQESNLVLRELIRSAGTPQSLILPKFTIINQSLGQHYGLPISGSNFTKIATSQRGGLLQQAAFFNATSNSSDETIPAQRGVRVMDRFLCQSIGFNLGQPASAEEVAESKERLAKLPVHERVSEHSKNPACASCHTLMDPIGLGLENFDAFGNWRANYHDDQPVIANGTLFNQSFETSKGLTKVIENSNTFSDCVKKRVMSFATAIDPYLPQGCSLQQLDGGQKNKTLREAIIDTVTLDIFRKIRFTGGE